MTIINYNIINKYTHTIDSEYDVIPDNTQLSTMITQIKAYWSNRGYEALNFTTEEQ